MKVAVAKYPIGEPRDFGEFGVRVNAICPGLVATDMLDDLLSEHARWSGTDKETVRAAFEARTPLRRVVRPEEIAELAAFLFSPGAAGMTGQSILYDGGLLQV